MIFDLPIHPLAVHLPVVLVPVSFVLVSIAVLSRRARPRVAVVAVALAVVGGLGTVGAYLSGDLLAQDVGEPLDHARWGLPTMISGLVFGALAVIWLLASRRGRTEGGASQEDAPAGRAGTVTGALTVLAAVTATTFVVLAGHSGATATWAGTGSSDSEAPGSESTTPADDATATADAELTMAAVEENDSADSCWVAIDGTVYDLTDWAPEHPGGADRIEGLCGTDGTEAFSGQHDGQSAPMEALARFEVGPLTD